MPASGKCQLMKVHESSFGERSELYSVVEPCHHVAGSWDGQETLGETASRGIGSTLQEQDRLCLDKIKIINASLMLCMTLFQSSLKHSK